MTNPYVCIYHFSILCCSFTNGIFSPVVKEVHNLVRAHINLSCVPPKTPRPLQDKELLIIHEVLYKQSIENMTCKYTFYLGKFNN